MKQDGMKKLLLNILLVVILLIIIVASVCLLIPGDMGVIAVMKEISTFTLLSILGALLIFMYIKGAVLKKKIRVLCIVMGMLCVVVGFINIFNGIRGLQSGLRTVSTTRYELYSPNYTKVTKSYYIKTRVDGELTKIAIDDYTYEKLQGVNSSISISYYPYINVADNVNVNGD